MNSTLSKVLIFAAGAAIGSAVTWKLLDAKYAQRAESEIKEIKEYYEGKYEADPEEAYNEWAEKNPDLAKEERAEYANLVTNYNGMKGGSESVNVGTPPYIIPPEEFDMEDDYETVSLTYYTDGVLSDDDGNIYENREDTVGEDFVNHFGDYAEDPDTVFVRNERLKTDYEICMDYRPYSDVFTTDTNPDGDE